MNFILADINILAARYADTVNSGPFSNLTATWWIIIIGSMAASWLVGAMMKHRFKQYSQIAMPMSGREVAQKMLNDNNIFDVKVTSVAGQLTDHYNPANKTVNLSEAVYDSRSLAAAAVAAHEVGHAVQHAQAYHWLTMRSKLVPVVQLSSSLVSIVLMIGIVLMAAGGNSWVLLAGIILFGMTTLFAFITLPVEFDASRRALQWISRSGISTYATQSGARSALFWAAMTYVVGALSSLAMLLYYVMIFMNGRRN